MRPLLSSSNLINFHVAYTRHPLLTQPAIGVILALSVAGYMLVLANEGFSQDQEGSSPPKVFQPGETKHGFSEFDSLPEIYADDPPPHSQNVPSSGQVQVLHEPNDKPEGLFMQIEFAEGFEEEQGIRKGHWVVPVNPSNKFSPDTRAVYLVFSLFKHSAPYQVFGKLYPDRVSNLEPETLLDEDTMYIAAEDESGYLQFYPQSGRWTPGTYQVKIFVGWQTNEVNQMGTMRFQISADPSPMANSTD